MEAWNMVLRLPAPALAVLALFACGLFAVHGWNFLRLKRVRDDVRTAIGREGYDVQDIGLRWLTRGPFPGLRRPGLRGSRGQFLYRVVARDRNGRLRTGWVEWRAGWPWRASAPWTLRWEDVSSPARQGLSTAQLLAMLVPLTAVVLLILARMLRFAG
jgi:hypothetical protein